MELMRGETVNEKTDWYDPERRALQLQSYSQPMMEMAVACARSPVGAWLPAGTASACCRSAAPRTTR